jgi:hypothetical protein
MRTLLFSSLVALGLVSACDRKSDNDKVIETAPKPVETTEPSTTPPSSVPPSSAEPSAVPPSSAEPSSVPPSSVPPATGSTLDIESERTALSRSIDERAAALDAKIDALEQRGDAKSKEAVATLRAKRDQARGKMTELGARTQENWATFKKDVSDTWDQLERDVNEATR